MFKKNWYSQRRNEEEKIIDPAFEWKSRGVTWTDWKNTRHTHFFWPGWGERCTYFAVGVMSGLVAVLILIYGNFLPLP